MLFQNKKMGLLSVGLACLLSGCNMPVMSDVSCASSAGLQSTSTSVESEPAVSAPPDSLCLKKQKRFHAYEQRFF